MKFSIIIPAYNVQDYLPECVKSVVEQQYKDYEILLIDDGSTDRTGELCDQLAKEHGQIRVIHKENGGVASARNAGIDAAAGEYILFLDGDDWAVGESLQVLAAAIAEDPDKSLYICSCHIGDERVVPKPKPLDNACLKTEDCFQLLYYVMINSLPWHVSRYVYNKDFLNSAGIRFDGKYTIGEDGDFNTRVILEAKPVKYLEIPLFFYRTGREGSLTSKMTHKAVKSNFEFMLFWYNQFERWQGTYESEYVYRVKQLFANAFCTAIRFIARVEGEGVAELTEIVKKNIHVIDCVIGMQYILCAIVIKFFGIRLGGRILSKIK